MTSRFPRLPHWFQKYYATWQQRLARRPAGLMFPVGLLLGSGCASLALLGLGSWGGIVLCLALLGAAVPLVLGAEPVTRPVPVLPQGARRRQPTRPEGQPEPVPRGEPAPPAAPRIRVVEDIPGLLEMVELPAGTFRMGSPDDDTQAYDDERPQHEVTVSGFAIGRFLVTRQLYREIIPDSPREWARDTDDGRLPANYVDWFGVVEFCNRLSVHQGYTPCYRREGSTVHWEREADGYRLPTEAEWEYAARAGTETRWFCGDESTMLADYAWFNEDFTGRPHPVGEKLPNPWELYDMAGNVYEWCWDWHGAYAAEATTDPVGPPRGAGRLLRGGAYWYVARRLRSANRRRLEPEFRRDFIGCRVVRRPRRQPLSR